MAASTKPTSTIGTFLMHSTDGTKWEKFLDVKSTPDLGGEPEMIETTTLSDRIKKQVAGVQDLDNLQLTTNYTHDGYEKAKAVEGKPDSLWAIWMGYTVGSNGELVPTGEDGKFSFTAELSVYVNGTEVNGVREMTLTLLPSSEIKDELAGA